MDLRKIYILRLLIITVYLAVVVDILFAQSVNIPGALPAEFSVSATNKVYFSQGNLQYCNNIYTADYNTWKFADNQYDNLGINNVYSISYQNGWIDLFAYGTSGWNSGYTYYRPNEFTPSSSCSNNHYLTEDLTGDYANADWGVYNSIVNGGNTAGLWRTLTIEEWEYLIKGRTNASNLCYYASISTGTASINGLMLFPDTSTINSKINYYGNLDSTFFTCTDWISVQTLFHAVFLPITGTLDNQTYYDADSLTFGRYEGCYWSSSGYACNTVSIGAFQKAYSFRFSPTNLNLSVGKGGMLLNSSRSVNRKFAVRLVYDDHHIIFKNYDDSIICEESAASGSIPTCNYIPTKPSSDFYIYTFRGWGNVVAATKDTVYYAQYDSVEVPLCFTARNDSLTVRFDIQNVTHQIQYSIDKLNWINYTSNTDIKLNVNQSVFFRSVDSQSTAFAFGGVDYYNNSRFYFSGSDSSKVEVSGNIMSLYGPDCPNLPLQPYAFSNLFSDCAILTSAPTLPATILADFCYVGMFSGCASLNVAPTLPATILADYCYQQMFQGCTSLNAAPELPATTLADYCYQYMFQGCTSLATAPTLPATTLASHCYSGMFLGCTSLNTASPLPATTLASHCYSGMFLGCTSLNTASPLPATTLASHCYSGMFTRCSSLKSVPSLPATILTDYCYSSMFSGCTSLNVAPELPATTLADGCYYYMFNECTSLNEAPQLPATTLAPNCYSDMFHNCTALNVAPMLPATTLTNNCYRGMFIGCTSLNIAPSLPATTLASSCYNNMFNGCTSLNAAPTLPATILAKSCYSSMFYGCTSLDTAPILPAITLADDCYNSMFKGCTFLNTAPTLPATNLTSGCYYSMFSGCTTLEKISSLPADTLAEVCYAYMFQGCISLDTAPTLPATTLANSCYFSMFNGCTSLNAAPALPATTLANSCYFSMFSGCTSLNAAPALPATTLADNCYAAMFSNCISLDATPTLPATTLANNCYSSMFSGCLSLTSLPALPATTLKENCYNHMFSNCSSLKVNIAEPGIEWRIFADTIESNSLLCMFLGTSGTMHGTPSVNTNYYIVNDSIITSLCFTAINDNANIRFDIKNATHLIEYSTDGANWNSYTPNTNISIDVNQSVQFRAVSNQTIATAFGNNDTVNSSRFYISSSGSGVVRCSGSIMSLYGPDCPDVQLQPRAFEYLFYGCSLLTSVPKLPATHLASQCYKDMFKNCTAITVPPKLPALELADSCYCGMFSGCTSLIISPVLPATAMSEQCYRSMFDNCISLTMPPALPATALADNCYRDMFIGCSSLVGAPSLPADTMVNSCYRGMFAYCTSLSTPPALPAIVLANNCYRDLFTGCSSLLNAPLLPATTLEDSCYLAMFSGCTSLVEPPYLPATTLAKNCYHDMFKNCSSLTSAPALPAMNLSEECYSYMFYGCSSLCTPPALPATTLADGCYHDMFKYCSALLTTPELPATNLAIHCYERMFYYCTSLTSLPNLPATILPACCYYRMFWGCNSLVINTSGSGKQWRLSINTTPPDDALSNMFHGTSGTMNGTPAINTTYRISSVVYHTVTLNVNDTSVGGVSGAGRYENGQEATLIATPKPHCHFVCWSNGDTSLTIKYLAIGDTTLLATFAIDQYTITASGINCQVAGGGCFNYGSTITLTATGNQHYHFVRWTDGNTSNPRTIIVIEDESYSAIFEIDKHTISTSGTNGTISGGGMYDYGSTINLTATPNMHYYFSRWSDGNTSNPRSITVIDNTTYTAIFEGNLHNIKANGVNGIVSGGGKYHYGSTAVLSATPNTHFHFVRWSDGNNTNPRTVNVFGDATYKAIFEIDKYTVSDSCVNGSVIGVGEYDYGSKITINPLPDQYYSFVSWLDGDTSETRTFILKGDTVVTAIFDLTLYNISATCKNGNVTGNGQYRYPDIVTLTVMLDEGYKFVEWSDGNGYNPRVFVAEEDLTIEALCEEAPEVGVDDVKDNYPQFYVVGNIIYNSANELLRVYSASGKLLQQSEINIELTSYPSGVYIVVDERGNSNKVVVNHIY